MSSQTVKRQRKRKRIDQDGDPEFQVAPMVDVLLVLMLFFMAITSTEVLKKNKNVALAAATHGKPQDKPDSNELVVNITWDGVNNVAQFSMDEIGYPSAEALGAVLGSRHQQNPRAYVLIRADKNVEYSNVADLMSACGSAGISTVTFAVLTGGGTNKQAPPAAAGGAASN